MKANKITPEWHKLITDIANELPVLQRVENGKPMFRLGKKSKIHGSLISPEQAKTIENFELDKDYIVQEKFPVFINHEVGLRNAFKKAGQIGVVLYMDSVLK